MLQHKPKLQCLSQPPEPSATLTKPYVSPPVMPSLTPPTQPLSLAPSMPPLMGVTCLQPPTWSSGTLFTISPLALRMKETMLKL